MEVDPQTLTTPAGVSETMDKVNELLKYYEGERDWVKHTAGMYAQGCILAAAVKDNPKLVVCHRAGLFFERQLRTFCQNYIPGYEKLARECKERYLQLHVRYAELNMLSNEPGLRITPFATFENSPFLQYSTLPTGKEIARDSDKHLESFGEQFTETFGSVFTDTDMPPSAVVDQDSFAPFDDINGMPVEPLTPPAAQPPPDEPPTAAAPAIIQYTPTDENPIAYEDEWFSYDSTGSVRVPRGRYGAYKLKPPEPGFIFNPDALLPTYDPCTTLMHIPDPSIPQPPMDPVLQDLLRKVDEENKLKTGRPGVWDSKDPVYNISDQPVDEVECPTANPPVASTSVIPSVTNPKEQGTVCKVEGCDGEVYRKQRCNPCRQYLQKHGTDRTSTELAEAMERRKTYTSNRESVPRTKNCGRCKTRPSRDCVQEAGMWLCNACAQPYYKRRRQQS